MAVFELLPQKAKDWHMEQGRSTALGAFTLSPTTRDGEDGGGSGQGLQRPQHDGIGALRSASEAVKRAVDVEAVVRKLEDPWAYAAAKYLNWRLKSKMEFSEYHQLLQRCRQHVILGREETPWTLRSWRRRSWYTFRWRGSFKKGVAGAKLQDDSR